VGAQDVAEAHRPYEVQAFDRCSFGGLVEGYDLREAIGKPEMVARLRRDMERYKLLVFRGQTELSGEDHLALSEQFGSTDHGLHRPHPRAPDPRLLRISNSEAEGFVQVGTSGWHVDGVMLQAPFAVQTMHFLSAIPGGDTLFLGLGELLGAMPEDLQERMRRLWFVSGVGKNLIAGDGQLSLLPLVHKHPKTGEDSMCFHLGSQYCVAWIEEIEADTGGLFGGFMAGFLGGPGAADVNLAQGTLRRLLGDGPSKFNVLPPGPTQDLLTRLIDSLDEVSRERAIWRQEWQTGDFALIDNCALAHLPDREGTQAPAVETGLRIFHRTTMVDLGMRLTSSRGARSVLLAGRPERLAEACREGAMVDPAALGCVVRALTSAAGDEDAALVGAPAVTGGKSQGTSQPAFALGPQEQEVPSSTSNSPPPPAPSGKLVSRLRAKADKLKAAAAASN